MTNQRYVTPAVVAAALHVAFLFGVNPDCPEIVISTPVRKPPKPEYMKVPLEELPPPEVRNAETKVAEVKPMRGDPPPPELPPPPARPERSDFTSEDTPRVIMATYSGPKIPAMVGVPDGDPRGRSDWTNMPSIAGVGDLDKMPRAKVQIAPDYPFELKRTGVEGSVLIEFEVDTTGQVVSARVLRSDQREFEAPTLRAVLKWRFEPGKRNGRPVPFRMQIPVDFHLNLD